MSFELPFSRNCKGAYKARWARAIPDRIALCQRSATRFRQTSKGALASPEARANPGRSGLAKATCAGAALALVALPLPAAHAEDVLPQMAPPVQSAANPDRWYFQTSAYTMHFDPKPDHNNHQRLISLEWQAARRWVLGGAFFDNSFGQPSQYLYGGLLWRPMDSLPDLQVKLTAGLVHGYKGEHQDAIPFNDLGIAPVVLPAVGYAGKRFGTEIVIYGTAGLIWNVGIYFK
jgi:hypothetical protein